MYHKVNNKKSCKVIYLSIFCIANFSYADNKETVIESQDKNIVYTHNEKTGIGILQLAPPKSDFNYKNKSYKDTSYNTFDKFIINHPITMKLSPESDTKIVIAEVHDINGAILKNQMKFEETKNKQPDFLLISKHGINCNQCSIINAYSISFSSPKSIEILNLPNRKNRMYAKDKIEFKSNKIDIKAGIFESNNINIYSKQSKNRNEINVYSGVFLVANKQTHIEINNADLYFSADVFGNNYYLQANNAKINHNAGLYTKNVRYDLKDKSSLDDHSLANRGALVYTKEGTPMVELKHKEEINNFRLSLKDSTLIKNRKFNYHSLSEKGRLINYEIRDCQKATSCNVETDKKNELIQHMNNI